MRKSYVYVTHEPRNADFNATTKWGIPVFLTQEDVNGVEGSKRDRDIVAELSEGLEPFNAERDWIVPAGSPYVTALVFMILGRWQIRKVRVLRWDNRDREYRECILSI